MTIFREGPAHTRPILEGLIGSQAYGTTLPESSDFDYLGVCIEPPEYVIGHRTFNSWRESSSPQGTRSSPGDVERSIHSLRKFVSLAAKGNPSVLALLWSPHFPAFNSYGSRLLALRGHLVTKAIIAPHLGYASSQRKALLGERGQTVHRPDLVAAHGFDTKFALHLVRILAQGVELLESGQLTLPILEPLRTWLVEVRKGEHTLQEVLDKATEYEERLKELEKIAHFPEGPDWDLLDRWLIHHYTDYWAGRRFPTPFIF